MNLGICLRPSIATQGEYCISARIAPAVQVGATRQELIETASVGLLMGENLALEHDLPGKGFGGYSFGRREMGK